MKAILRSAVAALALTFSMAGALPAAFAADSAAAEAEKGRALTTGELYRIYKNRSWIWNDGAGYFRISKRDFTAWTKSGAQGSYADGIWFLTDPGRLCFRAQWNAVDGSARDQTCFEHRTNGGKIYQRRLPDGEWYVFSNRAPQPYDEIRKLKRGDHVTRQYRANKRYIDARAPKGTTCSTLLCRFLGS